MKIIAFCVFHLLLINSYGQLIQGTIKPGPASNKVEIWLKPDFNNSTEYLYQIALPIAFPASVTPVPASLSVSLDAGFVSAFGSNYSVTVNPLTQNTGGTEKYFNIVLIRSGSGASNSQNWTSGSEFKVLTATFSDTSASAQIKLADYQNGGSDKQGNFYTVSGTDDYYVTSNSVGNFYSSSGLSSTGGTSSDGYVQTVSNILLRSNPVATGTSQDVVPDKNEETPVGKTIFALYPNPADKIVNILIESDTHDNIIIIVVNSEGKQELQKRVTISQGYNRIPFVVNSLPKGIYFVRVLNMSSRYEAITGRFVKL